MHRGNMRGVFVTSTDSCFNLALEEYLFNALNAHEPGWFLLWVNAPCIIVGRHQNTVQEVNQELVRRSNLPVVRRVTGGGAVFQDLGNLNFSFLTPASVEESGNKLDFGTFLQPVMQTLHSLGVEAEFSSRNDLTCQGRKVSGSAQLRRPQGVLHHGTLLVDMDMDMLGAVLTGAPDKYLSKGIASLRSRVANLVEFFSSGTGMAELKTALMAACAHEVVELSPEILQQAEVLAQSKYRSEAWNYGASPPFTELRRQRFPWGAVECRMEVRRGQIVACRIFGDFFAQREMVELESLVCSCAYTCEALQEALATVDWECFFSGCEPEEMRQFFCTF